MATRYCRIVRTRLKGTESNLLRAVWAFFPQKKDEQDTEDEGSRMGTRGYQQRRVGGGQAKVRHSWASSSSNIAVVRHIHSASGSFRLLADEKSDGLRPFLPSDRLRPILSLKFSPSTTLTIIMIELKTWCENWHNCDSWIAVKLLIR
jgi:hypothetical protein